MSEQKLREANDIAKTLREWADKELFGTNVNRESHLGYIAAREIERLRALPSGYVQVPREATAENGLKALLIGEFYEDIEVIDPEGENGETCMQRVDVSWSTIKEIYRKAVAHFAATPTPSDSKPGEGT